MHRSCASRWRGRLPRSAAGVTRGFKITATSAWCGTRDSNVRTTVVLPVPTSPVNWMKPPDSLMP
jgi:hypothetical protein